MNTTDRPTQPSGATPLPARSKTLTEQILAELFGPAQHRTFTVKLWDGTVEPPRSAAPSQFTLVVRHAGALRRMLLLPTEARLGAAYLRDDFDIEGDIEAATALEAAIANRVQSPRTLARLAAHVLQLPATNPAPELTARRRMPRPLRGGRHSRARDAQAVRYHYDVGNDFYALWLDEHMVYSCGYFDSETTDLTTAQSAKLDLICRKLRLQPGEQLLDIGCGWGGLVQHAAKHYGVSAVGITLSQEQAELARARIRQAGLSERCQIEVRDYRSFPAGVAFDKIASVGMCEHVGRAKLPAYFAHAYRLLRPGGVFLNHGIITQTALHPLVRPVAETVYRQTGFIPRYVFPDGELITLAEMTQFAAGPGFETRDVENLRDHYTLTLRHWVRRLEARHAEATALVGEQTYRLWRLYMAGCAHAFARGRVGVVQMLLSKPDRSGRAQLPLTRADIYHTRPS